MNKREFLLKLEAELARLPKREVEDALSYYNEYFDEAGVENEAQVIEDLVSPAKVATQIKADYAVKQIDRKSQEEERQRKTPVVLWVILGIFAAPVALPVAIAAGALAIALFCVIGAVVLALLIAVGAVFAAGIVSVIVGIASLVVNFANAIMAIGVGLVTIGIMALLGYVIIVGAKLLFGFIARKINESRQRRIIKKERGGEDA